MENKKPVIVGIGELLCGMFCLQEKEPVVLL